MRDELHQDIQTTAENVIGDATALTKVEQRKIDSNDPGELERLSDEAEKIAHDLAKKASLEKRLVAVANAQDRLRRAGGTHGKTGA